MKTFPALLSLFVVVLAPGLASAHCDTLDGPVVKTAQKALETGKLEPVLAWVQPGDEAEIRAAFAQASRVRKLGPEARDLADRSFLETLVRVHRAGEGAPYTGLKPAGVQDPSLVAADKAIETGKVEPVTKLLTDAVKTGLSERFARLRALKPPGDDVSKGREWVEAYVAYVHYVEGVHQLSAGKAGEHAEPRQAQAERHGH
jgi:hypothetical protein